MIATLHASERLLQRVFLMKEYTYQDIQKATVFLEKEFRNVQTTYRDTKISLPTFPNMLAIIREGMIITIKSKLKAPRMDEKKRKRLLLKSNKH